MQLKMMSVIISYKTLLFSTVDGQLCVLSLGSAEGSGLGVGVGVSRSSSGSRLTLRSRESTLLRKRRGNKGDCNNK